MRRVWVLMTTIGAAALTLFVVTAPAAPEPSAGRVESMRELQGVNFVSACAFSHRRLDDPIVYPRRPGFSHDHSFVGNRTTNAFSTLRTLRAGSTTCRREGDTAAYWMPTLFVDGRAVEPRGATIYYRRRTLEPVRPFPAGLRMIAGEGHSSSPQDLRITFWNCGAAAGVGPSAHAPTCSDDRRAGLRLHVNFPNCWDGRNLDSADHKRHLAYSIRGRCPATHPVAVPAIALIFRYAVTGGPGVSLASGGSHSSHADFFNAWNQASLTSLVHGCLNALRHCAQGS